MTLTYNSNAVLYSVKLNYWRIRVENMKLKIQRIFFSFLFYANLQKCIYIFYRNIKCCQRAINKRRYFSYIAYGCIVALYVIYCGLTI